MAQTVNLDALIPREDFDNKEDTNGIPRNVSTLSITDLKYDSFFFANLRKPDFQRETNEWDSDKIVSLVESFIDQQLIPAIILWRNAKSSKFVIDGSHRLSALAAWVNDDYGDGKISKEFYDGRIPDEEIEIAEKTRNLIKKNVGLFSDYELAIHHPEKVQEEIAAKAKFLGAIPLQLQWVDGNAERAEQSFFKINQQAVSINKTELKLLKSRRKPSGVATRAIMRSGIGHKYWSFLAIEKQLEIQMIAKEIHSLLFEPKLTNPIKTLNLPLAGKSTSTQTQSLVLDFVNIVNSDKFVKEKYEANDVDGEMTVQCLKNCRKILYRINSSNPSSLGLHPAIYLYSINGRFKTTSFYALLHFMNVLEEGKGFDKFIECRELFEELIRDYDYLIQAIVRNKRESMKAYPFVAEFYVMAVESLLETRNVKETVEQIKSSDKFSGILKDASLEKEETLSSTFSRAVKSATFIKEALKNTPKCAICGGLLHKSSISIDHINRKADGGLGNSDNAQLTHPYCNSTFKN